MSTGVFRVYCILANTSKAQFSRVNKIMRSRAPRIAHPRSVGSTFLLSGLVKCYRCKRARSGRSGEPAMQTASVDIIDGRAVASPARSYHIGGGCYDAAKRRERVAEAA